MTNLKHLLAATAVTAVAGLGIAGTANAAPMLLRTNDTVVETFAGSGSSPDKVQLSASGLFFDTGSVSLGKPGDQQVISLSRGNVYVATYGETDVNSMGRGCRELGTVTGYWHAYLATGSFTGDHGDGTYKVTFSETFPVVKGHCNENGTPSGASVTFYATGPMTGTGR